MQKISKKRQWYLGTDLRKQKQIYQTSLGGWPVLKTWDGKPWLVISENELVAQEWAINHRIPLYAVQYVRSVHTFANRRPELISHLVFVGNWRKNPFIQKQDYTAFLDDWMPGWGAKALIQSRDSHITQSE
jgi:hypothetical protein